MTGVETGGCEQCPGSAGRVLSTLATQYVRPEEWLFARPEEQATFGIFSPCAVLAATEYFHMGDPVSLRYGVPYEIFNHDLSEVEAARSRLAEGEPLEPVHIARLARLAYARAERIRGFNEQPTGFRRDIAASATPFLEEAAADLAMAELDGLADGFPEPEYTTLEAIPMALRQIFRETRGLKRVHELDQMPFLVARQALRACTGPWECAQPRALWLPPRALRVCRYGERSADYVYAKNAVQGN